MKNKKGIAPLIAWVLIISFAIAMALLITKWVIDNIEDISFESEGELYCGDLSISVNNICKINENETRINITNNGNFKITRLSIGRATNKTPEEWCLKLLSDPAENFNPGTNQVYNLTTGRMQGNLIGNETTIYQDCDKVTPFSQEEKVVMIALVPWTSIEDNTISCIDKKIQLDNLNITNC